MHSTFSAVHANDSSMHKFSVPVTGTQNAPLHHCASAGASSSAGPVIPEVLDPLDDPDLSMEEDWTYFALGANLGRDMAQTQF